MKLFEDHEINKMIQPRWYVGSYQEAEVRPFPEDFKLSEVKDCEPPKLELVFRSNGQDRNGRITHKEGSASSASRLSFYKKELEEQLIGKTWSEILQHDFKWNKASKLD